MAKKTTKKQDEPQKSAPAPRLYFVPGVGEVAAVDLTQLEEKLKKEEVGDANN